ncbi:hypothetical protein [Micromonospora sp. CPCC 206061]|uniref:hypothetical protein n=1 Tax=Micromonospora sp. CPCC 206061 TaxID=3122410 RepID=UPI002FF243F3
MNRRGTALWDAVCAAAAGHRRGTAGAAAELATVDGVPRLGWAAPPPWRAVRRALLPFGDLLRADRVVFVGTGGWAFGLRAVAETADPAGRLRIVDRLDPAAVAEALNDAPAATVVVAVSESGRTTETALLAEALRDRFALAPRWLRGADIPIDPRRPTVALFGAPVSRPFLLAAALAGGDLSALGEAYRGFLGLAWATGRWAAAASRRIPETPSRVRLVLPHGSGAGLVLFVLQSIRQGLGGKVASTREEPWWEVGTAPAEGAVTLRLPAPRGRVPTLTRLMTHCHAAAALVACVGLQRGIRFADHPAVRHYKELLGGALPDPLPVPAGELLPHAAAWLRRRPELARAHLVCYDPAAWPRLAGAVPRLATLSRGGWEVHRGSTWNHHSYQAAYPAADLGVVAIAPPAALDPLTRAQANIAAATCASLGERALLLRLAPAVGAGEARAS